MRQRLLNLSAIALCTCVLVSCGGGGSGPSSVASESTNTFSPTSGALVTPRTNSTVDVLADGTVFIVGGTGKSPNVILSGTEKFDSTSGVFRSGPAMTMARNLHSTTRLPNGQLLVAGGNNDNGFLADAELYDPQSDVFRSTGGMSQGRREHSATLLPNGKVLIAGGFTITSSGNATLSSAELYTPPAGTAAGTFSTTGSMSAPRQNHTATLLLNGKVLITGGYVPCSPTACDVTRNALASAEIYDPMTGTFSATGSMNAARHHHTATLLPNGRVLITGGATAQGGIYVPVASTEIYDPASGTFAPGGGMTSPRSYHSATLLSNGKVLLAGGFVSPFSPISSLTATAELFDPIGGTSSPTGNMGMQRASHTATLLPNGQVLILGGVNGMTIAETAEVFR